ncbi:MAG TPA: hypothetical protein VFQ07_10860 [Candidatus Polarisedimenticolia bacterium]|nr:hypothetical protein [Candidatus Polarisedimenticolia bacterium]
MNASALGRPLSAAVLLCAASLSTTHAAVTSLRIDDRAGATGEFYYLVSPSAAIEDSPLSPSSPQQVGLEASDPHLGGWSLRFRAPSGQDLAPGRYDMPRYPDAGDPELRLYPTFGSWCYGSPGSFLVKQVQFDAAGGLQAFWADFETSCGSQNLTGEIRFNADADTQVVLQAPTRATGVEGRALSLAVAGHDPAGNPAALEAIGVPSGASFLDQGDGTGTFSFTPVAGQAGRSWIQWIARTPDGATDSAWTLLDVFPDFDDFDHPLRIATLPYTGIFDSPPLTAAPDDPACGPADLLTAWFEFLPGEDDRVQFYVGRDSGGPFYYVSVYEDEGGSLRHLGCSSWGYVRADVVAGRSYRLLVGLPAPISRFIVLADTLPPPPPNDARGRATVIAALPFHETIDAGGATPDDSDPPVCTSPDLRNPNVWYAYTPAIDTRVTIDIPYDETTLFRGPTDALVDMACGYQTPITFTARVGETYHFMTSQPIYPLSWPISVHVTGRPAFDLQATMETSGAVDLRTGSARVQGTANCSFPAHVRLTGEVRQGTAAGAFVAEFACDGATPWSAAVTPSGNVPGRRGPGFRKGPADVVIEASGAAEDDPGDVVTRQVRVRVLLRTARVP